MGRIFLIFSLIFLASCGSSNYLINERQLWRDEIKAIDNANPEFIVKKNSTDTLHGKLLKISYSKYDYKNIFYNNERVSRNDLECAQTKKGFWIWHNDNRLCRIRHGKINAYYYQTSDAERNINYRNPNVAFEVTHTGSTKTYFMFEKEPGIFNEIKDLQVLKVAIEDNKTALKLFNAYYPSIAKANVGYKEILKIIDEYNKQ
jgi:hypothetical protein